MGRQDHERRSITVDFEECLGSRSVTRPNDGGVTSLSHIKPTARTVESGWSDGSLASLSNIIEKCVPKPKRYETVMPPMGGSPLTKQDLAAVSAYVWAISHAGNP